jgi:beta-lactamase regulating signal transducer with metallopeptidase domain
MGSLEPTTAIELVIQQPAAQAIGWALLQFVWQGALVGLLTAGVLAALRQGAADVRYVVATIGLSLMITMPIVTAVQAWPEADRSTASVAVAPASTPVDAVAPTTVASVPQVPGTFPEKVPGTFGEGARPWQVEWLAPWLLFGWALGVLALTLRLLSGWIYVQRMKTRGVSAIDAALQRAAKRLLKQLHISRRVTFLESSVVDVPTVIGWMTPVVLLPASALAGLSPQQLEAILAHELAHIRRHDYLVNLLQTLVETLLFYHPAVWWLSHRIRVERENCCDDLAVSLCGDPVTYAQALADLEQLRGAESRLVLAASGGSLLHRVRRLLGAPSHAGRGPGWLAGAVAIVLTAGIAAGAVSQDETFNTADGVSVSTPIAQDQWPPAPPPPPVPATPPVPPAPPAPPAKPIAAWPMPMPPLPPEPPSAPLPPLPPEPIEPPMPPVAMGAMPVPPAPPAAPSVPVPPSAPAPPAPPMFGESQSISISKNDSQESGNYRWSHNGQKIEVDYRGKVEFTDDDSDVKSLTPNGWLRIKDGGFFGGDHAVEFKADSAGTIERRYWSGRNEQPFEPEGRKWLSQMLPKFIRQSGIGAQSRVERIRRTQGVAGVLSEIALIEGSWAKRVYYSHLLKGGGLDARTVAQILTKAGAEIESDYELASLLISAGDLLTDDETRKAYFDAARTIGSDYEMRRVFSSALKNGPVSQSLLNSVLDTSTAIDGDYEQASLLVQVAKTQPLDSTTRAAFFRAYTNIQGDYEQQRVLSAVLERTDLSPDIFNSVVESIGTINGDYAAASTLLKVAKQQAIEGSMRAPFFRAVSSIESSYERGRVLQTVAKHPASSEATILEVIRSAQGMTGAYERSQVLLAVAASHSLSKEARDAYLDAAEKLGDYEQGRVLSALVKNERRK